MLMGLPSRNGYVTGTLFMPRVIIETLKTEEAILNFFEENFPDALDLLGRYACEMDVIISVKNVCLFHIRLYMYIQKYIFDVHLRAFDVQ